MGRSWSSDTGGGKGGGKRGIGNPSGGRKACKVVISHYCSHMSCIHTSCIQVIELASSLTKPPESANKDEDPEQTELTGEVSVAIFCMGGGDRGGRSYSRIPRASPPAPLCSGPHASPLFPSPQGPRASPLPPSAQVHARLFSGGLLPACGRVSSVLDSALEASHHLAFACVRSLQLPQQITQVCAWSICSLRCRLRDTDYSLSNLVPFITLPPPYCFRCCLASVPSWPPSSRG